MSSEGNPSRADSSISWRRGDNSPVRIHQTNAGNSYKNKYSSCNNSNKRSEANSRSSKARSYQGSEHGNNNGSKHNSNSGRQATNRRRYSENRQSHSSSLSSTSSSSSYSSSSPQCQSCRITLNIFEKERKVMLCDRCSNTSTSLARLSHVTPAVWTKHQRQSLQQAYESLAAFDAYMAGIKELVLLVLAPVLADIVLDYLCLINVAQVEQQIISLVSEVIDSRDLDEAARCVLDLGTTVLNRIIVQKALLLAVERYWERHYPIIDLLKHLLKIHLLSRTHFEKGLEALLIQCEVDIVEDNPRVFVRVGECLNSLKNELVDVALCVRRVPLSSRHLAQIFREDKS